MTYQQSVTRCICCGSQALRPYYENMFDDRYGYPGYFALLKCSSCEQFVTEPRLEDESLSEVYTRYYPRRSIDLEGLECRLATRVNGKQARFLRWVTGTNNQGQYYAEPGMNVLDIGCGDGASLLELRKLGAAGYGIEADRNVEKIAAHFDLKIHIGSIFEEPFPGVTFDLIVLNQVIEHIPNPEKLLAILKERLRPSGQVVMSFPNASSIYRRLFGRSWINWHIPYHIHHFNRWSFGRLCQKTGYEMLFSRSVTPNVWTLLQFKVLFTRRAEGRPNPIWTPTLDDIVEPLSQTSASRSFGARLLRRLARWGAKGIAGAAIPVVNRGIDVLGFGDSLIVVVTPRDYATSRLRP